MPIKKCIRVCLQFLLYYTPLLCQLSFGWGSFAHSKIGENACDNLPEPLKSYYETNKNLIGQHSVDPDRWKRGDPSENSRHFLDIDYYGTFPFSSLPHPWDEATTKYSMDTILRHGILPWRVDEYTKRLTQAFKEKRWDDVILDSGALCHYVADAYVPLHATKNFNGQESGNRGIHSRFESTMVQKYKNELRYTISSVEYISNPIDDTFHTLLESNIYVQPTLYADTLAYGDDSTYGDIYYKELWRTLGSLAEQRINQAAQATASYWYTAWSDAGKPELPKPEPTPQ